MRTGKTAAKITHGRAEGVNHSLLAKFRRKKGRRGYVNVRKRGGACRPSRTFAGACPSPAECAGRVYQSIITTCASVENSRPHKFQKCALVADF